MELFNWSVLGVTHEWLATEFEKKFPQCLHLFTLFILGMKSVNKCLDIVLSSIAKGEAVQNEKEVKLP